MKTKYIVATLFAILISVTGCDKGFEEVNKNPLLPTYIDPCYQVSSVQDDFARDGWHYEGCIIQQLNLIILGQEAAGNHNIRKDNFTNIQWNGMYGILKQVIDVIVTYGNDPNKSNICNIARILKAWAFMRLVDYYGDVPYNDACKGYYEGLFFPKYDKQADIYLEIEKELIAATDALDPAKDKHTSDMYYNGDIAKWKKLGNSLLLRLGMRYSKLNPTKAQQLVQKAIDPARGGVILTNADNCKVPFNATQTNATNQFCTNSTRQNWHVGRPMVDFMKANNDPRMPYLICLYSDPNSSSGGTKNTNPADQIGCPFGYDPTTISQDPLYPGEISSGIYKYSQFNRQTCGRVDAWAYLVTAAQTQLLLAEATYRGWISTGTTAQQYYENAITQVMTQADIYSTTRGGASPITSGQITSYLAQPGVAWDNSKALELINTQYWLASFLIWDEAWANFRRSGYPALKKNGYPGEDPSVTAGDGFIHRMTYPDSETSYNKANVEAAAQSIGGDNLATRVFWDVKP